MNGNTQWISFLGILFVIQLQPPPGAYSLLDRDLIIYGTSRNKYGRIESGSHACDYRHIRMCKLGNSYATIQMWCLAPYPIEWVFNGEEDTKRSSRERYEGTSRSIPNKYADSILLQYNIMTANEKLVCRSVQNHNDSILVRISPVVSIDDNSIQITTHENVTAEENTFRNASPCSIRFEVTQVSSLYYWRGYSNFSNINEFDVATIEEYRAEEQRHEVSTVKFYPCETAPYCANTYRALRIPPSCLTVVKDVSPDEIADATSYRVWTQMPPTSQAGVALCTVYRYDVDEFGERQNVTAKAHAAVEYFFSGEIGLPSGRHRQLRFTQTDNLLKGDMIWMDPFPSTDPCYTADIFEARIWAPIYGFSSAALVVTFNGTSEIETLDCDLSFCEPYSFRPDRKHKGERYYDIKLNFSANGPGEYKILCEAPVWNAESWTKMNKTISVREVVPLHFGGMDSVEEVIQCAERDTNVILECDAVGDPMPVDIEWDWDTSICPGTPNLGPMLVLPRVSVQYHGSVINCTAKNKFGQNANKLFKLQVKAPVPTTTVVVTALAVGLGLLLVLGLSLFYIKIRKLRKLVAILADNEVDEFLKGNTIQEMGKKPCKQLPNYVALKSNPLVIDDLPYNSRCEKNWDNELGSGAFGTIHLGRLHLGVTHSIPIAVKTVKTDAPIEYFKMLMAELKILAHVGDHEHIVNLVAAYSKKIKFGTLYVGLELCRISLLEYLQQNQEAFQGCLKHGCSSRPQRIDADCDCSFTLHIHNRHLIRWAAEIATGMDFLAEQCVVHGDLAARNVLLSQDWQAKIGDFGLARQISDYTYLASPRGGAPWKWAAIESLLDTKFSLMSDVWSYGVTIWELFSLGNEPYPDVNEYSGAFLMELQNGLRPPNPEYASEPIYDIMKRCWAKDKGERPKFSELMTFFKPGGSGSGSEEPFLN